MRVWNSLDEVPTDLPRTVVTLGNFDGVHRGHREVLRRVVELARARDALAVAVTFTPHPRVVHHPEAPHVDIISPEQRVVLLDEAGLDAVLLQRYTLEFADQSPEEFVRGMLVHGLHAAVVVVGHDVRFGRGNTGDFAEMVRLGARYGFEVEAVEEFPAEQGAEPERRCSSTWVREALDAGDVAQAAAVLGRHHVLMRRGGARVRARPRARLPHGEPRDGCAGHDPGRRRLRRLGCTTRMAGCGRPRSPSARTPRSRTSPAWWRRT